ncbi:MAG: outer membrane protein [Hyphomicrobiales bacterium]
MANDLEGWQPDVEIVDKLPANMCLYAGLGGGVSALQKFSSPASSVKVDPKTTGFLDGTIGCNVMGYARTEFEFAYRFKSDLKTGSGSLRGYSGLGNLWLEPFELGGAIKPYLGGGLGFARNKLIDAGLPNTWKTRFAWQAGAGVSVKVHELLTLDLGYRYRDLGKASPGGYGHLTSHEGRVGLRFELGQFF